MNTMHKSDCTCGNCETVAERYARDSKGLTCMDCGRDIIVVGSGFGAEAVLCACKQKPAKPAKKVNMENWHESYEMDRQDRSEQFHTKSWSAAFKCRVCGKSRRWNLNFLGNRFVPVCNGISTYRDPKPKFFARQLEAERQWARDEQQKQWELGEECKAACRVDDGSRS